MNLRKVKGESLIYKTTEQNWTQGSYIFVYEPDV